jgi:hypothetical protein
MPDDVTCRVNLDDTVVELIRDKDVAGRVKSASGVCDSARAQDHAYTE